MNNKDDFNLVDPNIMNIDASQFELVHDKDKMIHDEKLKTKPTTFFKDALKRFRKNKSSVVGAVIIGILLLGSFTVPLISPYDAKTTQPFQSMLPPKLFDAGSGFWDGTKTYTHQILIPGTDNLIAGGPDETRGFVPSAIVKMYNQEETMQNSYSAYGTGGWIHCEKSIALKEEDNPYSNLIFFRNYTQLSFSESDNDKVSIVLGDTEDYLNGVICQKYRVSLMYNYREATKEYEESIVLSGDGTTGEGGWIDLTTDTIELDISSKLSSATMSECAIQLEALPIHTSDLRKSYMMIKSIELTTDSTDEAKQELYANVGFTDACPVVGYGPDSQRNYPVGYWQSNGTRTAYQATIHYVDVLYDLYEHTFGARTLSIGGSEIDSYINNGWCTYDYKNGGEFTSLSDKCPIIEVLGTPTYHSGAWQVDCSVTFYKYKGFSTMPRYLFGTNANGIDMLTLALSCLKTSLLVAIISSAACLIIGLIWGSISGYFGGTVDLVMERITDIISGIPWIVMMTLIILHLGNNVVTFGLALVMTGWIGTASRTRTQFYRFRDREYVLASKTLGARSPRLIFKHILPNGLGTIVTSSVLMIPSCIFSEASISYLGLGLQGVDSFGVLLSENQQFISSAPMLIVVPAVIISLLMISFNLFGNGLRDALNPTLKGGEQ